MEKKIQKSQNCLKGLGHTADFPLYLMSSGMFPYGLPSHFQTCVGEKPNIINKIRKPPGMIWFWEASEMILRNKQNLLTWTHKKIRTQKHLITVTHVPWCV